MAAGLLVLAGRMPARDANGRSTTGRIRVYENQTTTPVTVYSSSALSVALSQPIESDSAGQFPLIWIDSANTPVTVAYEDDSGQTATYDGLEASTAAAAALVNAYAGAVSFTFSTTTPDADPGAGTIRFNNATIASVTSLYIDNTSSGGTSVTGWLDSFDDANSTTNRGTIALRSVDDQSVFALFKVTGAITDGTGYRKVPVEYLSGVLPESGATLVMGFAAAGPASAATVTVGTTTALASTASPTVANSGTSSAAVLDFGIPRGAPGGVLYLFDNPTGDSDPGSGKVRFNNATPASVTSIFFDNTDANGNTVTGWLDSFDDTTNLVKGALTFRQLSNNRVITFTVSGSVVDGTGYRKVTVTHTSGTALFDDDAEVSVSFSTAGNPGSGVPAGGTTGQVLKKSSSTNYDAAWADADAAQVLRSARTADTQLVAADKGKLIEITGSGGFTQTFAAAATLGSGWFAYILNSSTGDVTLDANGTETIGGVNAATTAVLKPGQGTIVTSDGSNLYFATQPTGFRNMEIFKTSGTFTPKPGVSRYYIRAIGGGGAGYKVGGAAGGYAEGFATITSAQTVTIGAGSTNTASGGQTSVGSIVVCNGGESGDTNTSGPPSTGGTATFSGGLTFKGAGATAYGSAGNVGTQGASTPFGGGGAAGSQSSDNPQNAADNTGAGGGGRYGSGVGGYGGSGLVIFMW